MGEGVALAIQAGYQQIKKRQQARRRREVIPHRLPGDETPLWNLVAYELKAELAPRGAKTRFARYLGVPRQRVSDYLAGKRRLPDAETLLRMLHFLAERRAGRDPTL